MKKLTGLFFSSVLIFISAVSAAAAREPIDNVMMSDGGTLEAIFTFGQLLEKENLLIYEDSTTGFKAAAILEESNDSFHTVRYSFEDGDAYFSFKTDFELTDDKLRLTSIHSKSASLPHRKPVLMEYSDMPFGEIGYIEDAGFYYTNAGYVTEIRGFIKKGIIGQGVSLRVYENGTLHIQRTVLDTDTKGGYSARTFKEIIGSHSKEIMLAAAVTGWLLLKNVSMKNMGKNSAETNRKETF